MYNIRESINESIKKNTPEIILFSGGIDSSAVLYESMKYNKNVKALTVGIKENNNEDILYSKLVASKLNIPLLIREVNKQYVLSKVDEAVKILKSFSPEWISSMVTLIIGIEYAQKLGYKKIGGGEGADDLFGSFPFFKNYNGSKEELEYIINTRYDNIKVMTNIIAKAYNTLGITPFRDDIVKKTIQKIPLEIRMKETANIKTKYPLRMSYLDILPYESIVRPQTMAFTGSGVYDIIKTLEDDVSDNEYQKACENIFPFKNKLEYVLFKKYIKNYRYIKSHGDGCIHCDSVMDHNLVHCHACQTVQYKRKELKFNA